MHRTGTSSPVSYTHLAAASPRALISLVFPTFSVLLPVPVLTTLETARNPLPSPDPFKGGAPCLVPNRQNRRCGWYHRPALRVRRVRGGRVPFRCTPLYLVPISAGEKAPKGPDPEGERGSAESGPPAPTAASHALVPRFRCRDGGGQVGRTQGLTCLLYTSLSRETIPYFHVISRFQAIYFIRL